MKNLSINILFFEKADQTIECLQSFIETAPKVPIYVVNNGSSAASTDQLKKYIKNHPHVKIFDSLTNLGVSGGRNFLIRNTTEKWMFFVDNDITIQTKDWLPRIETYIQRHPEKEVFIPRLYNLHEKKYNKYQTFIFKNNQVLRGQNFLSKKINMFPGGAAIINRKIFERLGVYDEKMFVGFEDFDLCVSALKKKEPIQGYLINDIILFHDHRLALKNEDKASIKVRYDLDKHKKSYEQLVSKHGLVMREDWQDWLQNQVMIQLEGKTFSTQSLRHRLMTKINQIVGRKNSVKK